MNTFVKRESKKPAQVEAPIVLTPDQIALIAAGSSSEVKIPEPKSGATMGIKMR
jgi:hypothetical protein